jgi:hypothetical protein
MEIIKYLFEGFFITVVGMYIIGKEFNADNTVIMAVAIACLLVLTESIGTIYRYSKNKLITSVNTLERQIGGMDGTMSIQTALRMQEMLQRQSGGYSKKMKSEVENASDASNDEYTYGAYANYEKVYNMPQIPINKKEMEMLRSEHKLPHVNTLKRSIVARSKQVGGATEEDDDDDEEDDDDDEEDNEEIFQPELDMDKKKKTTKGTAGKAGKSGKAKSQKKKKKE